MSKKDGKHKLVHKFLGFSICAQLRGSKKPQGTEGHIRWSRASVFRQALRCFFVIHFPIEKFQDFGYVEYRALEIPQQRQQQEDKRTESNWNILVTSLNN